MENIFYAVQEYIPFYDYVHLQKYMRNLLDKDLLLDKNAKLSKQEGQGASWDHIKSTYEIDQQYFPNQRNMKKLMDNHIYPYLISKMKVKYAIQVLSYTVADFMDMILFLSKGNIKVNDTIMTLSENANATKKVLHFFNNLFDSFNRNINQGLSSIIIQNSRHLKFWQKALQTLNNMEFVEKKTYYSLTRNKTKCSNNWRQIIQSAQYLWKMLQDCGFTTLNLKYLNQDALENFFSQIRDYGHQKNNHTPYLFGRSFKALLTSNLTSKYSISANCIEDKTNFLPLLIDMHTEVIETSENNEATVECEEADIPQKSNTERILYININNIMNEIKKKIKIDCAQRTVILEDKNIAETIKRAIEIAEQRFYIICHNTGIKNKLIKLLNEEALFTVHFHYTDVHNIILNTLAHYFIIEWCNLINKILQGKIKYESKH